MNLLIEIILVGIGLGLIAVGITRCLVLIMCYDFHVKRVPWSRVQEEE